MRVVVPTTWYPTQQDPARAVFVRRHVEALALRHDVHVLALNAPGVVPEPPGPHTPRLVVEPLEVRLRHPPSMLAAAREVAARARALDAEVVHTMGFSSLALTGVHRRPWVHTEHWSGTAHPASAGRLWQAMAGARHLLRLPDRVTVVSTAMAQRLARFVRPANLDVVGNIVDPVDHLPAPRTRAIRLCAVGRLVEVKDPFAAVHTVAELQARGVEVELRWVGDGPMRGAVLAEAARLGVTERITILGRLHPAEVGAHLDWCTTFFLPTRHETFCVAAAEALAHARPVVIGAVGGQSDFVDGRVGRLVHQRDPGSWADAVLQVRDTLGDTPPEVLAAAVERFRPSAVAEAFDEVYGRALTR